ncbi:MAG: hypothetical protein KAX19_07555, partial [Candidatus Brocadiae bacterium]|nr:hypothetical protein [Candidatus Brocadiia bacterium]
VGFFFPAAARFEERRAALPAGGITRIYVGEAVGSAAAGALLSFYLLGRMPPATLVFGASAILLFLGASLASGLAGGPCAVGGALLVLLLCWSSAQGQPGLFFVAAALLSAAGYALRPRVRPRRRLDRATSAACVLLVLALCAAFLAWGRRLGGGTTAARWTTFSRFGLLEGRDTRYQHVELGEREGDYVLVQNGRLSSQFPDLPATRSRAALLLTQHPRPRDVLVIGGGLGGLCQRMLAAPLRALDYVEPDPQLVSLLYRHLPAELKEPLADPRFAAYNYDGRHFVQRSAREPAQLAARFLSAGEEAAGPRSAGRAPAGAYDLIVINVGDPTSASTSRFYTVEFYRELSRILRPDGVVAFCGITSSENYVRGQAVLHYTACIYRTLRSVFRWVVVRPGAEFCFFASAQRGAATSDAGILMDRFDALGLQPQGLKYGFELAEFPPERVRWTTGLLEEALPTALTNTDVRPVVFTLFLRVQAHFAGRQVGGPR